MYNYDQDTIADLRRKLAGLPPRKEILVGPEKIIPAKDVGRHLFDAFKKASKKRT